MLPGSCSSKLKPRPLSATFGLDCAFWIPVQAVNFLFVSNTFRVLYLGVTGFVWLNLLCIVKNLESYLDVLREEEEEGEI